MVEEIQKIPTPFLISIGTDDTRIFIPSPGLREAETEAADTYAELVVLYRVLLAVPNRVRLP